MGTYSYFSFTETAKQAFDLTELLNSQEQNEAGCNGVHYVLRLSRVLQVFDTTTGSLDRIMARYGVAWSGQTASHCLAAGHEQHTLTLDEMIDEKGMSDHWATKPEAFGTIITREQLAAEAGVELKPKPPSPEEKTPSPTAPTGGRWHLFGHGDRSVWIAASAGPHSNTTIAQVFGYYDGEAKANADLMAAAPDLLAACQQALETIEKHVPKTTFAPRMMLREAITKAKGEQP